MSLLLVPEVIRMYLSLKRIDSVFLSLGDIRGFIDIPGKLDNLPLLAKILETSQERVSLTRTWRWRSLEYLPSLVQSQIDWHDMSGHTDWIVFVTESTSVNMRTCIYTSGKNFIKITSVGMGAAKSNETR